MNFQDSVENLKGVGAKKREKIGLLGIRTVCDLVNYKPYKYQDRRKVVSSGSFVSGKAILAEAVIVSKKLRRISGGRAIIDCKAVDEAGFFNLRFFNMPYIIKNISINERYAVYGEVRIQNGNKTFINPDITKCGSSNDVRGILPVYRCVRGITNNDLRKWMKIVLEELDFSEGLFNQEYLDKNNLCGDEFAYKNLHFPSSERAYQAARYNLIYSEMFVYQIAMLVSKNSLQKENRESAIRDIDITPFIDSLSFELTDGQLNAIKDIERDLISNRAMNRLVQGDVGSGKTVVSEAAIYKVVKVGGQCAFLAPTEVLSKQHFIKLSDAFSKFNFKIALLNGRMKANERKNILAGLRDGTINLVIGTHALIQADVEFHNLKLVVTDEQHRFGVNQRKNLVDKSASVNVLVMSATPIPRTLAATVFGDMDFSIIRNMPAGRKKIITREVQEHNREIAYSALRKELEAGHQAYVVASAIDDNEFELESAEKLYEEMTDKFKGYKISLIHGRLSTEEKNRIMQDFIEKRIDILVSTVVIEVGIDVPNATIIVIENAERYGLAQLHQLRGRVGRSDMQSYCYLVRYSDSDNAVKRIDAMVRISDGFEISEEDFKLRGPGDIRGTMQHGSGSSIMMEMYEYEELAERSLADAKSIIKNNFKNVNRCRLEIMLRDLYDDYSYVI